MKNKRYILLTVLLCALIVCTNVINWAKIKELRTQNNTLEEKTTLLESRLVTLEAMNEPEETESNKSFYQKLVDGDRVSILIVGDSIGAGCGVDDVSLRWENLFFAWITENYGDIIENFNNISMGANTSYAGYVRTQNLDDGIDYDCVIVCYGQNDRPEGFSLEYEMLLRTIAQKYPSSTIFPIMENSQKTYTSKMVDIFNLANYYEYAYVDTIKAAYDAEDGLNEYLADGTHPNAKGQKLYCDTLCRVIEQGIAEETPFVKMKEIPYNGGAQDADTYLYFGREAFTQVDALTLELSMEYPVYADLGIYRLLLNGENNVEVYIDGEWLARATNGNWAGYELEKIERLPAEKCLINEKVTLVFSTEEQVNAFYGMAMNGYPQF